MFQLILVLLPIQAFNYTMLSGDIFVNYELTALADLPASFAAFYSLQRFGRPNTLAGAQVSSQPLFQGSFTYYKL